MKIDPRYILAIVVILLVDIAAFRMIDKAADESLAYEKRLLLNQAKAHFDDQVNTRSWNAQYGGVYVRPKPGQEPNPYLKNNTIKDEHNQTLIKINPAWMTRQLSELAKIDGYHFRITSLEPLNPSNKATPFEHKALRYMVENNRTSYYEFDDAHQRFNYMGALITQPACMPCHQHQGYKVGDLRGGISVSLAADEHHASRQQIATGQLWQKTVVVILSVIIAILIFKVLKHAKELELKVQERTREINRTRLLLQAVLDAELSFLVVTDEHNIIYVNQTLLNFFGYSNQEEFEKSQINISEYFDRLEDDEYLQSEIEGIGWIEYLLKHQHQRPLKVLIKKGRQNRFFRPHAKEIDVDGKRLFLIIFDEITEDLKERKALEAIASTDPLTGLANRSKFDQVIEQQVELAQTTQMPLSMIFLDLDHFKQVNDQLGHNIGDDVLKRTADLIKESVRKGDFISRWGGEEFVIILQSTEADDALHLAQKIRSHIEANDYGHNLRQTISCGVTQYKENESPGDMIHRADKALYQAKENGRNRVESL